jgi:hypothetical protein
MEVKARSCAESKLHVRSSPRICGRYLKELDMRTRFLNGPGLVITYKGKLELYVYVFAHILVVCCL